MMAALQSLIGAGFVEPLEDLEGLVLGCRIGKSIYVLPLTAQVGPYGHLEALQQAVVVRAASHRTADIGLKLTRRHTANKREGKGRNVDRATSYAVIGEGSIPGPGFEVEGPVG